MGSEKNFVQLLERKRPPSTRRPIKPQRPTTIIRKYQNQNQNPNQKSNSNLYENKQNHNLDKPTKTSENMIIKNVHQSQDHQGKHYIRGKKTHIYVNNDLFLFLFSFPFFFNFVRLYYEH